MKTLVKTQVAGKTFVIVEDASADFRYAVNAGNKRVNAFCELRDALNLVATLTAQALQA